MDVSTMLVAKDSQRPRIGRIIVSEFREWSGIMSNEVALESVKRKLLSRIVKHDGGCWEWTGAKRHGGYGVMKVGSKLSQTHRLSYEVHRGSIADGMLVMHSCDNPACINPEHLSLGTNAENLRDAGAKGRIAHSRRKNAGLPPDIRQQVEQMAAAGVTVYAIVKQLILPRTTVSRFVARLRRVAANQVTFVPRKESR